MELRGRQAEEPRIHGHEALVEEIRRDPGRADVRPRLDGRRPAGVDVEGVEDHLAAQRADLDLREERLALVDRETKLDADGLADVERAGVLAVLVDDAQRLELDDLAGPQRLPEPGVLPCDRGTRCRLEILRDDFLARPLGDDPSGVEPVRTVAEPRDRLHVVRDEDDRSSRLADVLDTTHAALLELVIADREHLVDEEHLGLEMRRHREGEPDVHAARVALDGRVDELLDPAELDDLVVLRTDLPAPHAEDRAVEVDVLAARSTPGGTRCRPRGCCRRGRGSSPCRSSAA